VDAVEATASDTVGDPTAVEPYGQHLPPSDVAVLTRGQHRDRLVGALGSL
jgi:hypothetical protein